MRICVSVYPLGEGDPAPRKQLGASGHEIVYNPYGRRLRADEIVEFVGAAHALIAGTEPLTANVLRACPNLKVVSRVGSGYDSVDLEAARERGIVVAYTPQGPARSVAELAIGLALDCLRGITESDRATRAGEWSRPAGRLLGARTVGVAGTSHVGAVVVELLKAFGCQVIGHDLVPKPALGIPYVSKEELLARSEVLFIHLPLVASTRNWLGPAEFAQMPEGAVLINAARGGIVDERALADALASGQISRAGIDVFAEEPYQGPLTRVPNVVLTAHIGGQAQESRVQMELEAVANALAVLDGRPCGNEVPHP